LPHLSLDTVGLLGLSGSAHSTYITGLKTPLNCMASHVMAGPFFGQFLFPSVGFSIPEVD